MGNWSYLDNFIKGRVCKVKNGDIIDDMDICIDILIRCFKIYKLVSGIFFFSKTGIYLIIFFNKVGNNFFNIIWGIVYSFFYLNIYF